MTSPVLSPVVSPRTGPVATLPLIRYVVRHGMIEETSLVDVLTTCGAQVSVRYDGEVEPGSAEIHWLVGTPRFYPKLLRSLEALTRDARPFLVAWHTEPLPPPRASGLPRPPRMTLREWWQGRQLAEGPYHVSANARAVRRLVRLGLPEVLAVSTPARQEYLAEIGIRSEWVPMGYRPEYGRDLKRRRDIDVLFLGEVRIPRRLELLEGLRRTGLDVVALGDWNGSETWGEKRTALLNRTRVFLNFPRTEGELSGLRFLLGMANGALVVSEPIYRPDPYVPGEHFVMAPTTELPALIRHYLDHEEDRARIAERARTFVTGELLAERSVARILELCADVLARRQVAR